VIKCHIRHRSTQGVTLHFILMGVFRTLAVVIFLRLSLPDPPPFSSALLAPDLTKQTLSFRDAQTGVTVHIIGTMHYNPHSISKTAAIIHSYGQKGQLGSVGIESCDRRWNLAQVLQPPGSLVRQLLDNEFQTAADVGRQYIDTDVVLFDEAIEDNDSRINEAFLSSVRDTLNPLGGGWTAISDDIVRGTTESVDPTFVSDGGSTEDTTYLDPSALFDPQMMLGAPVSLTRYALAIILRKPLKGTLLLTWTLTLIGLLVTRGFPGLSFAEGAIASVGGVVLSGLVGLPLLGRVVLVALLGERNEIIGGNIRAECQRLVEIGKEDAVCVAVLGLAHCNGVKRVLCEDVE